MKLRRSVNQCPALLLSPAPHCGIKLTSRSPPTSCHGLPHPGSAGHKGKTLPVRWVRCLVAVSIERWYVCYRGVSLWNRGVTGNHGVRPTQSGGRLQYRRFADGNLNDVFHGYLFTHGATLSGQNSTTSEKMVVGIPFVFLLEVRICVL